MSRANYSEDSDGGWAYICWRGAVKAATNGARGQALLKELIAAMDAMPVKELISDELVSEGNYCALGLVAATRGVDVSRIDPESHGCVAAALNIAPALAREIAFINDDDEWADRQNTGAARWGRVRRWAERHIV